MLGEQGGVPFHRWDEFKNDITQGQPTVTEDNSSWNPVAGTHEETAV